MASNEYFNQLKADICGKEIVELRYKEAELIGLAVIGSCFLGRYSSCKEAACAMVKIERRYEPDSKNTDVYNQLYSEYIESRNFLVKGG
jgi:sugar (pentulose or hexulose) kinase